MSKIILAFLFLGVTFNSAHSRSIEDVPAYVEELESRLPCPKIVPNVVDQLGNTVEVMYFCRGEKTPVIQEAIVRNAKGQMVIDLSVTDFGGDDIVISEKQYTYISDRYVSKIEGSVLKFSPDRGFVKTVSTYEDYNPGGQRTRLLTVKTGVSTEESWEYSTNGALSKHSVVTIKGHDKEELIEEYNASAQKVRETELYYEIEDPVPYKRIVTEYEPAGQRILSSVTYDYENGVEKIKTVCSYEKGKMVSELVYELIYDEDGNLKREKKLKK